MNKKLAVPLLCGVMVLSLWMSHCHFQGCCGYHQMRNEGGAYSKSTLKRHRAPH